EGAARLRRGPGPLHPRAEARPAAERLTVPVTVTLEERDGGLWWGGVRVAAAAAGHLPEPARKALLAAGLAVPQRLAGYLYVRRCARCPAWVLGVRRTRFCGGRAGPGDSRAPARPRPR